MITVGIDVGSTATKAVLLDDGKLYSLVIPTGWSPREAGEKAVKQLLEEQGYQREDVAYIVGTGYGRIALNFVDKVVTEITCHGRGASYLAPGVDLVIDIGGQDSKVIKIAEDGRVVDFAMNDKCAAGTGRFLQVMATALGLDVSELGEMSKDAVPAKINNMCTVFAESEVIGLLAQGASKEEIVAGLHESISQRIAAMVKKVGLGQKLMFTGGVALNQGVKSNLEKELGHTIEVRQECQLMGAIGAALIALDQGTVK